MTDDELKKLISDCPRLFHMAERGAWQGIKQRGLLSTSALLDDYGIAGKPREAIESEWRGEICTISGDGLPHMIAGA